MSHFLLFVMKKPWERNRLNPQKPLVAVFFFHSFSLRLYSLVAIRVHILSSAARQRNKTTFTTNIFAAAFFPSSIVWGSWFGSDNIHFELFSPKNATKSHSNYFKFDSHPFLPSHSLCCSFALSMHSAVLVPILFFALAWAFSCGTAPNESNERNNNENGMAV